MSLSVFTKKRNKSETSGLFDRNSDNVETSGLFDINSDKDKLLQKVNSNESLIRWDDINVHGFF